MGKRKFHYIANAGRTTFQYVGKQVSLNGIFKIFQNNQFIEIRFNNELFTIIEILKNGIMLRGAGYGEIVDVDDDSSWNAEQRYGNGPFLLTNNEIRRKR
jgi:hypothetical protein